MSSKKESLTQAETDLIPVVRDKWIDLALKNNGAGIDTEKFETGIEWLYQRFLNLPKPQVVYCDGWLSALIKLTLVKDFGKELSDYDPSMIEKFEKGEMDEDFVSKLRSNIGLRSSYIGWANYGWCSFYDYFTQIGQLDNDDFNNYLKLIEANAFECYEFEHAVFVIQPPKVINQNEAGQLHSVTGEAILFGDGTKYYFVNGRRVPAKLFTEGFTKEDFNGETNEDIRGAMFEIIEAKGEGSMLDFLGAEVFSEETITHANGETETFTLYRTSDTYPELVDLNGNSNVPLCWLRIVCPSTGQNYLISTDVSFNTPSEAAKFHRPEEVPFDVDYTWSSRS